MKIEGLVCGLGASLASAGADGGSQRLSAAGRLIAVGAPESMLAGAERRRRRAKRAPLPPGGPRLRWIDCNWRAPSRPLGRRINKSQGGGRARKAIELSGLD